jgi:hypothetical protein
MCRKPRTIGAVQATPVHAMHSDLIENIFFGEGLNFLVSAIMPVVIAFCIAVQEVVMNYLCGCIKLRGCVGLNQGTSKRQRNSWSEEPGCPWEDRDRLHAFSSPDLFMLSLAKSIPFMGTNRISKNGTAEDCVVAVW